MGSFLFILGKDDNEAATRCFQFAKVAHEKGHTVNLFLIDGGVMWADKNRDLSQKTVTGDCPKDYWPYLLENKVQTGVWIPCAKNRQVGEDNFYENMYLAGAPKIIDIAAEAKVFNF